MADLPPPPSEAGTSAVFTDAPPGTAPFFAPLYIGREVRVYPILEPELDTLSVLNTTATACLSVASGAFGFALNIMWNRLLRPDASPTEHHIDSMEKAGIGVCFVIIVAAGITAVAAIRSKHSRIGKLGTKTTLGA
jgi:hypothetical protein